MPKGVFYRSNPKAFWKKVKKGKGCWLWVGSSNSGGYGQTCWNGQHVQAHRVAFVLHSCDNRLCCRPSHLYLGTMKRNNLEAYERGRNRQPRGCNHANSKLRKGDATKIRKAVAKGVQRKNLAVQYGMTPAAIGQLVRGNTYRNEL